MIHLDRATRPLMLDVEAAAAGCVLRCSHESIKRKLFYSGGIEIFALHQFRERDGDAVVCCRWAFV